MIAPLVFASMISLANAASAADLKLPTFFADHMVLQRDTEASIWGWGPANESITIESSWGAKAQAKADDKGAWKTKLKTPAAGGPHTLTVAGGGKKIELKDVLSGEVWLCSGQSNMEMTVGAKYFGVQGAEQEIAKADHPDIRMFDVPNTVSATPLTDCAGQWKICSSKTVNEFSAAAYFFAIELQGQLKIPIGLLESDWGGTPAEAWTSMEAVSRFKEYADGVALLKKIGVDPEAAKREQSAITTAWWKKLDDLDPGVKDGWAKPTFKDQDWEVTKVPGPWSGELTNFDGVVWQRIGVDIPAVWEGRTMTLDLGPIDDFDDTYFNGTHVGGMHEIGNHVKPRSYKIPSELVKGGRAVIAVRVVDTGGPGGLTGKAEAIKIHPVDDFEGVMLSDTWLCHKGPAMSALPPMPQPTAIGPGTPSALFNGMIAPLIPFTIRGAIWYQGESNRGLANIYRDLFTTMITDWRTRFGVGDFPFYFVQIAPYNYNDPTNKAADIREAQRLTLSLPNTGMAVTTDIGNVADIHPKNKQDVGKRLALWALNKTYGKSDVVYSGPLFKAVKIDGGKARITFDHATGLSSHGKPLTEFQVAGSDGKFVAAKAEIDGDTVVVSSDSVAAPVAVRYGYTDVAEATLWNAAGLPASPFTTEQPGSH